MLIVMNCSYILGERELVDVRTFSAYFFLLPASVVLHLVPAAPTEERECTTVFL
jgi:hypothetical protein